MKIETELTTMKNWGTGTQGKSVSYLPTIQLLLCNGDSWVTLQSQRVNRRRSYNPHPQQIQVHNTCHSKWFTFTATVALLKVADGYPGIEKHRAEAGMQQLNQMTNTIFVFHSLEGSLNPSKGQ